jgi:hypothetical protein
MKRPALILISGLALAILTAGVTFQLARKSPPAADAAPELGWLASEFQLSPAECERVETFHKAYLQDCGRMCQKIAGKNREIRELLASTNVVMSEVQKKLHEAAELRAECHGKMLEHFLRVSAAMPPEQGRRYLDWVLERTILADTGMSHARSESHDGGH